MNDPTDITRIGGVFALRITVYLTFSLLKEIPHTERPSFDFVDIDAQSAVAVLD